MKARQEKSLFVIVLVIFGTNVQALRKNGQAFGSKCSQEMVWFGSLISVE